MKTERRFLVRKSGGKLGWPRFWITANRDGHGGMNFPSINLETGDAENNFYMSVEQAERLVELLPDAIKFAKATVARSAVLRTQETTEGK